MNPIDLDGWVRAHPFLEPLARFTSEVERAAAEVAPAPGSPAPIPDFATYAADFAEGVPLLSSPAVGVDLEPAREAAAELAARIAGGADADPGAGLLQYVTWTALRRHLAPVLDAFARWRDEDSWMHAWCPACGSAPAMAQLLALDAARVRHLCCGSCGTRWRFGRTRCPFCDDDGEPTLRSIAIAGEAGLRIDWCESCRGYLKTYDGQGNENVLLADWTSLHLDLAAHERGLARTAASLFDVESLILQPAE